MNEREVVLKDSGEVVGHACGLCGTVYSDRAPDGIAARCCLCSVCGREGKVWHGKDMPRRDHRACWERQERERRAAEDAKFRVPPPEGMALDETWTRFVSWADHGPQDGYFPNVGDLLAWCEEEGVEPPLWVHRCAPRHLAVDADSVIESACDEMHEDAAGDCDRTGLQELLDAWCEAQEVTSWDAEPGVAVPVRRPESEAGRAAE
jgi:hypothetical protein